MRSRATILFVLITSLAYSQFTNRTEYDLKVPPRDKVQKYCGEMRSKVDNLPPEARIGGTVIGDTAYVYFRDPKLFLQFFNDKKDGLAIDIINQEQFQCDNVHRLSNSNTHKGFLLEPIYRDEIKKRMRIERNGYTVVPVGRIPKNFDKQKIEPNYLLIDDQYGCYYHSNIIVSSHGWDLLPMGLYYDTLYRESMADRYRDLEKTLHFTIPFQKNTAIYKKEDIKPLYDSLRLTDFEIVAIRIRAFTSVEGSLKRNMELQDERARSIVAALQTFQPEKIKSDITSAENWVEFLESINGTSYRNMMTMTKDEVKEALKDPALAEKLEPILAKERKAIIELELEKRVSYIKSTKAELKTFFNQSIASKNINEALYLQEVIFHKIRREELEYDFLKELEIPKAIEYGSLLLNDATFAYEHDNTNDFEALRTFTELNQLLGGNPKVDYNICALRLRAWLKSPKLVNGDELKTKIESLKKKGIPEILVTRLMVNYSLVQTQIDLQAGRYREREQWLNYIMSTYKKIKTTDEDLLSLSKFLSNNSRYEWAEKVLEPRIKDIDVSADVLFYYLTLTIWDAKNTSSASYRTIMLNAVNNDVGRFCRIFAPTPQGGASFQLLEDDKLKKTWCENCNLPR